MFLIDLLLPWWGRVAYSRSPHMQLTQSQVNYSSLIQFAAARHLWFEQSVTCLLIFNM